MSDKCQFVSKCPIFGRFKHEGVKQYWIRSFCHRDSGERCARKKLRDSGATPQEVPITLLPNGMHLPELKELDETWEEASRNACGHIESCSTLFEKFQDPESKIFWGRHYCFVPGGNGCLRKKMMDEGTERSKIPVELLPSGDRFTPLLS